MPKGRPPKPVEQKRRTGRSPGKDSAGRPLPDADNVVQLRAIDGEIPRPPDTLVPDGPGVRRWTRLWMVAEKWLSPETDIDILTRLCEAEDLRHGMKEALATDGFMVAGSMGQMRPNPLIDKLRALDDQITKYESLCGFTPSDRGRLGVSEVGGKGAATSKDPLQAILEQAAQRRQA